jgi:hypothetical protein
MNPVLGDAVPLKLIPGFVGVLEIDEDEETIIQEGPFKTDVEIAADAPYAPSDPEAFVVMILFRNRHVRVAELGDSPTDFRLLVHTTDQLRQLGHAMLQAADEIDVQWRGRAWGKRQPGE